jgi:hypothetical protein
MDEFWCAPERKNTVKYDQLAAVSVEFTPDAENSFSPRKPDKMRALSVTHTMEP